MDEEQLKALQEELLKKQEDLDEREKDIKEREEALNEHKDDTATLVKQVKDEYEAKLLKQRDAYEKRLKEREAVIKQLLSGNGDANKPHENLIIDKINARRSAQNKKW
ncbi:MAG: hypothetical protein IJO25_05560 [Clostridia bacterium]|nr:hypothetical protein [Clostridia bacterium]